MSRLDELLPWAMQLRRGPISGYAIVGLITAIEQGLKRLGRFAPASPIPASAVISRRISARSSSLPLVKCKATLEASRAHAREGDISKWHGATY